MSRLSTCIFEWDAEDIAKLCRAKAALEECDEADARRMLSRKELALHCRRRTRGAETTTDLIDQLIESLRGDRGLDTLGMPIFDQPLMDKIWSEEKKHMTCIQDPVGVQLYVQTGTRRRGGVELKTYRCARGSVSLESFHLHITRFIPGTTASDAYFQALLLEGISRWNDDRMSAAVANATLKYRCFDDKLKAEHTRLSTKLWGRSLVEYRPPLRYTGELLGLEYLYSQTGRSFSLVTSDADADVDSVEMEELVEEDDEGYVEAEDMTVDLVVSVESAVRPSEETSTDQPPASPASSPERVQSPSPGNAEFGGETVGPDGLPGFDAVQDLAECLVSLDSVNYITNRQANRIVQLWDRLSDRDRQRLIYTRRYRARLRTRRLRQQGRRSFLPGRDSVRRAFLGRGTPAQKPGLSRVVDAICSRLYTKYRRDTVVRTDRGCLCVPKWKLILDKYADLQELVSNCAVLRDKTSLQLYSINLHTLRQWYTCLLSVCMHRSSVARIWCQGDTKFTPGDCRHIVPVRLCLGQSARKKIVVSRGKGGGARAPLLATPMMHCVR